MKIETNNGCFIEIEPLNYGGISVTHLNSDGNIHRRDRYTDGEIVAAINLLDYMRNYGHDSVYLIDEDGRNRFFKNSILNGDLEEFRIF